MIDKGVEIAVPELLIDQSAQTMFGQFQLESEGRNRKPLVTINPVLLHQTIQRSGQAGILSRKTRCIAFGLSHITLRLSEQIGLHSTERGEREQAKTHERPGRYRREGAREPEIDFPGLHDDDGKRIHCGYGQDRPAQSSALLDEIAPPSVPDDEQGVDDKRTARDIVQKPEGAGNGRRRYGADKAEQ